LSGKLLEPAPEATEEPEQWYGLHRAFGDTRILHVDLSRDHSREQRALASLDGTEQRRRDRFLHDSPKRRFTLCRAALRSVLCRMLGCRNEHLAFEASKHGKPFALVRGRPVPINFNVSHSGLHGLIALAPAGRIGVDVEERAPHRNLDELIAAVFGPGEQREIAEVRGSERLHLFFRLWTMKEALSKAHGMGLSLDVSRFEIPQDMRAGATSGSVRLADMPGVGWRLEDISTDRFAAAVAYESADR